MEEITPIYSIQGAGHTSTFVSRTVTTEGVVTAIDSNGFYIQAEAGDGNASTSDAIFVFTGTAPGVTLGHLVQVVGTVQEFTSANAAPGSLSITQLGGSPVITDLGLGSEIAATHRWG